MTERMTAEQYRNELAKPKAESKSKQVAREFAFQCTARRLPTPRWFDHTDGELAFAKEETGRLWRFDFAWPDQRIAVEIEGVVVRKIGNEVVCQGRHATITGMREDMVKYAWANVLGWHVLRFLPEQIKSGEAMDFLVRMFATAEDPVRVEVIREHFPRVSLHDEAAPLHFGHHAVADCARRRKGRGELG